MNRKRYEKSADIKFMAAAIRLALKAEGRTGPNPIVGAVVVKSGRIVGRGYHKGCGLPHAEVNALSDAGIGAKGADLYVTLEPCDHFGRTPPCTEAIVKSGISRVVVAVKDPNPVNNGRGIAKLKKCRIRTDVGILSAEARYINRPYIKFITTGMPYITVKIAQSIDGKIATFAGDSKWITGEDSRRYVHRLRGKVDAVMVGANTVLKDNPFLTNRVSGRQPERIIVDSAMRIPAGSNVFSDIKRSPVTIAVSRPSKKIVRYNGLARILVAGEKDGKVDLRRLFSALAKEGMTHIMVEGGGEIAASLIKERLADRFIFFIAPKIIGGKYAVTSVEGEGIAAVKDAYRLRYLSVRKFSEDLVIEAEAVQCLPE